MATPSKETIIKFKADTADYKAKINEMNQANKALTQELKLAQTQMKLTGTDVDKYKTSLSTLEKQYDIAKNKTKETAEQLQRTKQVWGENATETKKAEEALRRAQIAEADISNKIKTTSESLKQAQQAESLRNSEVGKSKQKLEELKNAHSGLKTESDKLKSAYELQAASLSKNASETSKAKLQYDYLKQAQQNAGEQSRNLAQQLENAKRAFGAESEEVKKLETELNRAKQAEIELGREVDALHQKVGTSFKTASSHVQEFGNKVKEVGKNVSDVGKDMSMKVTAPIAGAMGYAAKEASKFQHEMADIRKEVNATGLTSQQVNDVMSRMWDSSLANSQQFGVSTEKINEGLLVLVKDGYTAEEAMRIMTVSLHTARGANEDLAKTVDGLGSAYEATGQKTNNAEQNIAGINKMADIFAYTANHTKASVHSLTESMSIIGPTANAAGQDLAVTASAVGMLQSNGIEASVAARALKSGFVNLAKPTKAMSKAMAKMGFDAYDANGKMKQLPQVMDELEHSLQGMTQEQQNATLATIFGKEHLASWQILVHSGGEKLKKMADDARGATGEVKHLSEQMENTPENKFKELQQTLHTLAVQFGTEILPALMPVVEKLKELMDWISKLDPETKKTIVVIAALAAAIGPILIVIGATITAIGTIITAIGSVIGFIGTLIGWITGIGEAIGIIVTVIAGFVGAPVAAVVAAIAGIIAIVVAVIAIFNNWGGITDWLSEKWDEFSTWMSELWDGIAEGASEGWDSLSKTVSEGWDSVVEYFSGAWEDFKTGWSDFWTAFGQIASDMWTGISDWFSGIWDEFTQVCSDAWEGVKEGFSSFWEGLKEIAQTAWDILFGIITFPLQLLLTAFILIWEQIKEPVLEFWEWIKGYIKEAWEAISSTFTEYMDKAKEIINTGWTAVKDFTSSIWEGVKTIVSDAWKWISDQVSSFMAPIKSKVQEGWDYISSKTSEIWGKVSTAVSDKWNEMANKTSEKAADVKQKTTDGWNTVKEATSQKWNEISGNVSEAWTKISNDTRSKADDVRSKVDGAWNTIKSISSGIWNSIVSTVSGYWDSMVSKVQSKFDTIRSKISSAWDSVSSTLTSVYRPIQSAIDYFGDLYNGITRWLDKIVGKIRNAWNSAGDMIGKLNPFSSYSISVDSESEAPALASRSFAPMFAAPMAFSAPTTFASGGILGDAMSKVNGILSGGGMLSGLPDLAGNALAGKAGMNVINNQPQQITNEVTFHTTVRNESDMNKMFQKADDWFTQKGQSLNVGKGGSNRV
ncbi:phage tail tape measure protein [Bacillus cereus]|uniref:Phage tail tape measure protein n=1 Tax=Bacillus cereus TaxID=1396 RepID=A0A2B2LKG6_BACCE|nr:phage tail tape measure protein [Bacillus cereus]PFQ42772.1 phage tail tape measure protein [Bacillus cereus]